MLRGSKMGSQDTTRDIVFKGPYKAGALFVLPRNQGLRNTTFIVANHATREMLVVWDRSYGMYPKMKHPNILHMDYETTYGFWRSRARRTDNFVTNRLIRTYTAGKVPKYWYEMAENQAAEYVHLLDKYEPDEEYFSQ